jgi:hypothetical protein
MKKIMLVLIIAILGCELPLTIEDYENMDFDIPAINYEAEIKNFMDNDFLGSGKVFPESETIRDGILDPYDIIYWAYAHTSYRSESRDDWALPDQTYRRGYGDCEDYVILCMYLIRRDMGWADVKMLVTGNHALLRTPIGDYDPTAGLSALSLYNRTYMFGSTIYYGEVIKTADED